MKIIGKNVTRAEAKRIEQMVRRCIRLLRKKEYELDLPANAAALAINCLSVKRRKRTSSHAGECSICINLGYWQNTNPIHTEYASYNANPTIGQIVCTNEEDHNWVQVAHEVSHFIQYTYARHIKRFKPTYKKPHGKCFKDIYRYLRKDLINGIIADKPPANAGITGGPYARSP